MSHSDGSYQPPARDQPEGPRLVLALFVGLRFLLLPILKCTVPFSSGIYFGNSLVWFRVVCLHAAVTRRREALCLRCRVFGNPTFGKLERAYS